jgi:hypothetical protein
MDKGSTEKKETETTNETNTREHKNDSNKSQGSGDNLKAIISGSKNDRTSTICNDNGTRHDQTLFFGPI